MVTSTARTVAGGTVQVSLPDSTSTPCSRRQATVIATWGSEGMGGPSWRTLMPASYDAPASSSAETNWLDADASITTDPPRTLPVPTTVNGRVPRPPSSTSTPEPAQGADDSGHRTGARVRVTVEGDRTVREGGHRRDEAHHRAGETAVDEPSAQGAGRHRPVLSVGLDAGAEGGEGRRHQLGVARAQRTSYDRGTVGQGREDEGAVGQRLRAGELDPRVNGTSRRRRGPQVEAVLRACLHAPSEGIGGPRDGR